MCEKKKKKNYKKNGLEQENVRWNADIEVHILITKWERVPRLDPCSKTRSEFKHAYQMYQCTVQNIYSFE